MNNLIFGIITILLCILGYFFSFKYYKRINYKTAILLILICGLMLRLYTGTDLYLHTWDERYHALVAKNLLKHPLLPTLYENSIFPYDYKNWLENHVWLEKGPIPLWAIAGSLKIFGISEISVRIPSIIISTIAIYLTYLIGRLLYSRKVGLLAAFLHSINGLIIELAGGRISSDHVETFFIFFVELAILMSIYAIKNKKTYYFSILIGLFTGCSLLCKWMPGLIVFPVWFLGAYFANQNNFKKLLIHATLIIVVCFFIFFSWIIYTWNNFPNETKWVLSKFIFAYNNTIEGHSGLMYYYVHYIRIIFGELVYIPLLCGIFFLFRKNISWKLIMLTAWWLIPVIIFSFADTKRSTYLLISAPAFFIVTSYFWFYIKYIRIKVKYKFILNIILFLLILLPIRYCIERIKPFEIRDRNPIWTQQLKVIKNKIPKANNIILFNIERPIETMFYTDCIAYSMIPEYEIIEDLIKNGYIVLINEDGNLKIIQRKK
ncbi:MAG TPA: glycosyltransferase family 39 protein [Bacteroidales bacterium]|nr:glycosyltransferase family 39 protein [Bacteroidales bacterium]